MGGAGLGLPRTGEHFQMTSIETNRLQLGGDVPNFELAVYDPVKNDFGSTSLDQIKSQGKWTILFFYPADFTFV
jgi:NADH-dependent peroxiredoxin subunit C